MSENYVYCMNLKEFTSYRKTCIVCDATNVIVMNGSLKEDVGNSEIHCIFNYLFPIFRRNFMTFGAANIATFTSDETLDMSTLNRDKYETFLIDRDGYVSFDYAFRFKMKLRFRAFCPDGHYSYDSRQIRVSDKSPDITKGYPVEAETLMCQSYKIVSNPIQKTTAIFNFNASKEPIVVPYMEIINFPHDTADNFVRKIQNILLLA